MKIAIIMIAVAVAAGRLRLDFPAHGVSPTGSYEAFAHLIVSAMFAGPIVFWLLEWRCRLEERRLDRVYGPLFELVYGPYRSAAVLSFAAAFALTALEGVLFFVQVSYPWTLQP